MRIAFIVDPLTGLDPEVDTSVGLIRAALARADEAWVTHAEELEAVDGRARALARRITGPDLDATGACEVWLDEMTAVLMRTDPPVNGTYLTATHILDLVPPNRTAMVNDPRGLRLCNEKTYPLRFPDLCPPTIVAATNTTITDFLAEHGRVVMKPIDGYAGRGVLLLDPIDPNLASLIEISTDRGTRAVVLQRYLPEVHDGNKRLFVLDGIPTAAVWRYPAAHDFRIGPPAAPAPITDRDRQICARLAPSLQIDGLRMAGLDVIGDYLIEVNVTSPGALYKSDVLLGTTLCADLLNTLDPTDSKEMS